MFVVTFLKIFCNLYQKKQPFYETFLKACFINIIKLLQIDIPSDASGKHYSNDIEGLPLRIINISKFIVFYYYFLFYLISSFGSLFQ